MKVTDKTVQLLSNLEYIIDDSCFNPASYNSWTGDYGSSFRYPGCRIEHTDGKVYEEKTRGRLNNKPVKSVSSAFYKFGANHLCIGRALQELLTHLEERYDIDFEELGLRHRTVGGCVLDDLIISLCQTFT